MSLCRNLSQYISLRIKRHKKVVTHHSYLLTNRQMCKQHFRWISCCFKVQVSFFPTIIQNKSTLESRPICRDEFLCSPSQTGLEVSVEGWGRSCGIMTDPPQHRDLPADEQTELQMAEPAGQSAAERKLISWSLMLSLLTPVLACSPSGQPRPRPAGQQALIPHKPRVLHPEEQHLHIGAKPAAGDTKNSSEDTEDGLLGEAPHSGGSRHQVTCVLPMYIIHTQHVHSHQSRYSTFCRCS